MKLKGNHRGLTILELTIAAVVLGVIVALAAPEFGDTVQRLKFKGKSRDVLSDIRLTRSNAVSQRAQFGVHFDYTENGYTVFKDLINPDLLQYEAGDSVIKTVAWGNEAVLYYTSFEPSTIVFRPDGSASVSGDVLVNNPDNDERARINVLAATGRVKLSYESLEQQSQVDL
jgi:Tfp pilus assembly protein FimT